MFSIISIAAFFGVALGVMILIVVLSVMNGFEKEVKSRLLSFSPHVMARYAPANSYEPVVEWREIAKQVKELDEVTEAHGTIEDNAIIDHNDSQQPVRYRGIDTSDQSQIAALEKLIDKEMYPEATADIGLDGKVILSETKARQFGVSVGDTIQLYSTRNFDEVFKAYRQTERPPAHEEFAREIQAALDLTKEKVVKDARGEIFQFSDLNAIYDQFWQIHDENIRPSEREVFAQILEILNSGKIDGEQRILKKGEVEHIGLLITHLKELDISTDDMGTLKSLKSVILPKDLEVAGVYRISQQVVHPDLFLPLQVAQELSGLEDGVHGISITLKDADKANEIKGEVMAALDYGWFATSWMDDYASFFELIKLEKSMMSLVLSVVTLGAAFLITIVMFLIALQKRKEIGVMLAVGARPIQICAIFLIQGAIIGAFGVTGGILAGTGILKNRVSIQQFFLSQGVDIFPADFQGMSAIPAETPASMLVYIAILGLLLCCVAPLIPAIYSARTDPAKSLRDL